MKPYLGRTAIACCIFPFESVQGGPCSFCPDGARVALPDKKIVIPTTHHRELTCTEIENFVELLVPDETSKDCQLVQRLSSVCGCSLQVDNPCSLCPDGSPVSNPKFLVPQVEFLFGTEPSCEVLEAYLQSFSEDDTICPAIQSSTAESCGCILPNNIFDTTTNTTNLRDILDGAPEVLISDVTSGFMGVETHTQMWQLTICFRLSAILSLLGALVTILDIGRNRTSVNKNLYHQLITSMACCDIISSIFYVIGPLMTPAHDMMSSNYARNGSKATCTAQGVIITWSSLTSLFFNAALATFYVLLVVYSWDEPKFGTKKRWVLGSPVAAGVVLGAASMPYYASAVLFCGVARPLGLQTETVLGYDITWAPFLVIFLVPAYFVITFSTGAVIFAYWHVRAQEAMANTRFSSTQDEDEETPPGDRVIWFRRNTTCADETLDRSAARGDSTSLGRRRSLTTISTAQRRRRAKLRVEVFWQSVMYLLALNVCWVPQLVLLTGPRFLGGYFELWVTLAFFIPLQGFLNCLVYFRPRITNCWYNFVDARILRKQRTTGAQQPPSSDVVPVVSSVKSEVLHPYHRPKDPAQDLICLNTREHDTFWEGLQPSGEERDFTIGDASVEARVWKDKVSEFLSRVYCRSEENEQDLIVDTLENQPSEGASPSVNAQFICL